MAEDRLLVRFCNVWPIHEIYALGLTQNIRETGDSITTLNLLWVNFAQRF